MARRLSKAGIAGAALLVALVVAVSGAGAQDGTTEETLPGTTDTTGPVDEGEPSVISAGPEDDAALIAQLQGALDDVGADLSPLGATDAASLLDAARQATTDAGLEPGGGSSLTGPCLGFALSLDESGTVIDGAADFDPAGPPVDLLDGGQAFTADNPYHVDFKGLVVYAGSYTAGPPLDHSWHVEMYGTKLLDGGDDNPDGKAFSAGSVDLGDDVPLALRMNGLLKASGRFAPAELEACVGAAFVETAGGTPLAAGVGLILMVLGAAGLAFGARPRKTGV